MKDGKLALVDTLKRQILTLDLEPVHNLDEVQLSEKYGVRGLRCAMSCDGLHVRVTSRSEIIEALASSR